MLYRLLTRKYPYRLRLFDAQPGENYVGSASMKQIIERFGRKTVDFTLAPLDTSPEVRDLLQTMLSLEPRNRPSAEEVLKHKWFTTPIPAEPSQGNTCAVERIRH